MGAKTWLFDRRRGGHRGDPRCRVLLGLDRGFPLADPRPRRQPRTMHGTFCEHDAIQDPKTPRDHLRNISARIGLEKWCQADMERARSAIPDSLHSQTDRLWNGTTLSLQRATDVEPSTLVHGDCHVGQTYITADGRMGLAARAAGLLGQRLRLNCRVGTRAGRSTLVGARAPEDLPRTAGRGRRHGAVRRGLAHLQPAAVLPLLRVGLHDWPHVLPARDATRRVQPHEPSSVG